MPKCYGMPCILSDFEKDVVGEDRRVAIGFYGRLIVETRLWETRRAKNTHPLTVVPLRNVHCLAELSESLIVDADL
jgi:hypothetical protein